MSALLTAAVGAVHYVAIYEIARNGLAVQAQKAIRLIARRDSAILVNAASQLCVLLARKQVVAWVLRPATWASPWAIDNSDSNVR